MKNPKTRDKATKIRNKRLIRAIIYQDENYIHKQKKFEILQWELKLQKKLLSEKYDIPLSEVRFLYEAYTFSELYFWFDDKTQALKDLEFLKRRFSTEVINNIREKIIN